MSSAEESYIATSSYSEYSSDYAEYLSSSDEENNNLLFQDEIENKQERKRKRNLKKYKEMCDISENEAPPKKRSYKEESDQLNKQKIESTEDIVNTTNVKIKDLEKKDNIYTYNINVPKCAGVLIINLKKRDKRNTKIICNLDNPKLLHQSETEVIVSNNWNTR